MGSCSRNPTPWTVKSQNLQRFEAAVIEIVEDGAIAAAQAGPNFDSGLELSDDPLPDKVPALQC
jgi:hypothetical protein